MVCSERQCKEGESLVKTLRSFVIIGYTFACGNLHRHTHTLGGMKEDEDALGVSTGW